MWSACRWARSSGSRSISVNLGAAVVASLICVALLTACGPDKTTSTDPAITDFKDCTSNVATTLTQDQRTRIELAVSTAIKAVGGKGAVEFSNTLVHDTSDAVNVKVIETCFALAQNFPNTSPEVKIVYRNAGQEMQKKAPDLPLVTLHPAQGSLPVKVDVAGTNWPPNAQLTIKASGGASKEVTSDQNGEFREDLQLGEQARIEHENYATVVVQALGPVEEKIAIAAYTITDDSSTVKSPTSPRGTTTTPMKTTTKTTTTKITGTTTTKPTVG